MVATASSDVGAGGSSEPSVGDRIGPGPVILVVGPSGAGKDALIAAIREQAPEHLHFAERVVSRPSHAAEAHASASYEAMAAAVDAGAFALSWQAHGLIYGIPVAIDEHIRAGDAVIFNASRTVVAYARHRYARVFVVLVDAPASVRAARIAARGRESGAEIEKRLGRAIAGFDRSTVDCVVDNGADLQTGIARLAAAVSAIMGTSGSGLGGSPY